MANAPKLGSHETHLAKKVQRRIQDRMHESSQPDRLDQSTPASSAGNQTVLRQTVNSSPAEITPAGAQVAQQAYGNQFVQRLAKSKSAYRSPTNEVRRVDSAQRPIQNKVKWSHGKMVVHRSGEGEARVGPHTEAKIEQERGRGQPLPDQTRQNMEGSFGVDFSGVTVHHDAASHQLSRSLDARAFTTGPDIYFGENEYKPSTHEGDTLIAHELTHVVQQGGAAGPLQAKMTVNEPGDEYEQEADSMASMVMTKPQSDPATSVGIRPGLLIQREEKEMTEEEKEKIKQEAIEKGREEGKSNAPSKDGAEGGGEGGDTGEAEIPAAAEKGEMNEVEFSEADLGAEEAPEFSEADAEAMLAEGQAEANQILEDYKWTTVKPEGWDLQIATQEIFAQMMGQDTQPTEPTKQIIENPYPEDKWYDKPWEKDMKSSAGGWILWQTLANPVAGKFSDVAKTFANIGSETNVFGITAAILEGIIQILELITNILGIISLVMTIISVILYVIGTVLAVIPFTAASAPAFFSAATTLLTWAGKIGDIAMFITLGRMQMRVVVIALRALDYWYAWANGASAEELQAKTAAMADQAINFALDGVDAAMNKIPGAKDGASAGTKVAIDGGKAALGVGWGMTKDAVNPAGMAREAIESEKGAKKKKYEEDVKAADEQFKGEMAEYEEEREAWEAREEAQEQLQLPEVPIEAAQEVDDAAQNLASIHMEKVETMVSLNIFAADLETKKLSDQDMATAEVAAQENQAALASGGAAMSKQSESAQQFSAKAQETSQKGEALTEHTEKAKGDIEGQQGNINETAAKGAEQGEGDPALSQGGQASGQAAEAPVATANMAQASQQQAQEALQTAAKSDAVKAQTEQASEKTEEFKGVLAEQRGKNQGEMGMMEEHIGMLEERLAMLEEQEAQEQQEHAENLATTESWVQESRAVIEANKEVVLSEEDAAEFDSEAEGLAEVSASGDAEDQPEAVETEGA